MRCDLQAPAILPSPLDSAGKVVEYQERPQRGGGALRPSGTWGETAEWLHLPLQPTTSKSGALLTFAHCPNFKLRVSGRHPRCVLACFRRLGLKVNNFEQTIAMYICCFGNHRGIALSGPNPMPPSIIGLGGVVLFRVSYFVNFSNMSKMEQRRYGGGPRVCVSSPLIGIYR